ncbi:MAG: threonine synthase [Anaerolineae bacterium]|nr:threonine synthase [Anaerolineae bacterium]
MLSLLKCMDCGAEYPADQVMYTCPACGGLIDVQHDLETLRDHVSRDLFDARLGTWELPYRSGVWRYKELIGPDVADAHIVSRPEGNTNLYAAPRLARWAGLDHLWLKHEGENPTGSFKDRGMTSGVTQARVLGIEQVACASTGNTSASLAAYAAFGNLRAIVFFQEGQVALGKLAQAVAYGATCIQIPADFDTALRLVRDVADTMGVYLLNSVNPFRVEGQKSILFEMVQQLRWQAPDWVIVPGGNLGNSSAFGKALKELYQLGMIDRLPRLAVIQAEGANPLYQGYQDAFATHPTVHARTLATAIKIGDPVNYSKAVRALHWTDGVVEQVSDQHILDAKAQIDASGIGCEPASAATLAGAQKLVAAGVIKPQERVVGILTGHVLKDPGIIVDYHAETLDGIDVRYANHLHRAQPTLDAVQEILRGTELAV